MEQDLEVKIVSVETIKPSLPPSSHPKALVLSLLDQVFPAMHVSVLLFYSPAPQVGDVVSDLKMSLSQTLDQFYPLAGRFVDDSTISCNDHGIPFIETKVNCHLSVFMTSPHKLKLVNKFLPTRELIPLTIQVNVFLCGGVVIGCYMLHKLFDGASIGIFLNYWSALAGKRFKDLVQPDFEARIEAFPPLPSRGEQLLPETPPSQSSPTTTVIKSFLFNSAALSKLRGKATSEVVPRPTKFEAVAGFVWEQALAAARDSGALVEHTTFSMTVNMRPRMKPPLPWESMGNLITNARAQVDKSSRHKLQELVKEIHLALSRTNQKITTTFQGDNPPEVIWSARKAELQGISDHKDGGIFRLSSWCNLGLNEPDFGFGKPEWIVPTDGRIIPPTVAHFIYLTNYIHPSNGEGIEAWFFLEEKEVQVLESNPQFLAFASPNY
ncbi:vinorine synthase-like isoform X2 [Chenopodium quinoa]|uniref:vinorine synthase-like isoform X2 n=1 Tax=Chenopodium quinoa TaxID=63459 RepID=UPI000B77A15E|nr:vinorine synthase-like isoform X2 [Chenopodium quinoa]